MRQTLKRFLQKIWVKQIVKFIIVGGLGTITNLVIFYVLVDINAGNHFFSSILCFVIAASQNYLFNEKWTFIYDRKTHFERTRYLKFMAFSSLSLIINLSILEMLLYFYDFPYKVIPQGLGILAAMSVNFIASKFITFK